jgi:hypothetical protein
MHFDNAEYQCFHFFCHHRGEGNRYTANALGAEHATMEELRYHLKEVLPVGSVTTRRCHN